jgi:hypothetical protein
VSRATPGIAAALMTRLWNRRPRRVRRKGRGELLGALLLAADEVAQNLFVIGEGLVVAAVRLSKLAGEDIGAGGSSRRFDKQPLFGLPL